LYTHTVRYPITNDKALARADQIESKNLVSFCFFSNTW